MAQPSSFVSPLAAASSVAPHVPAISALPQSCSFLPSLDSPAASRTTLTATDTTDFAITSHATATARCAALSASAHSH